MKTPSAIFGIIVGLIGCGPDLGSCPLDYEMQISADGIHPGQAAIHRACAVPCHSAEKQGDTRNGVPAGLDFDLTAVGGTPQELAIAADGLTMTKEWMDDMWARIEDGTMPPEGAGTLTPANKESIRAFLACGADAQPVPVAGPSSNPFEEAFPTLDVLCSGCHQTTNAATLGGGFSLGSPGDICSAYDSIVSVASPACDPSRMLIAPGAPELSVLISKLDLVDLCGGSPMPLGPATVDNPFSAQNPAAMKALYEWVSMDAPKPSSCP